MTYRVAVLPGDGTGREVMVEAQRILTVLEAHSPLSFDITEIPCGGEHYLETGEEWPEGSFETCRDASDAVLLGAIGWPDAKLPNGDNAGGQCILGLRAGLELYANVRPIKLYRGIPHKIHGHFTSVWDPDQVDLVMIRENTEGLYYSLLRRSALQAAGAPPDAPMVEPEFPGLGDEVAWDPRPISRRGSERVIRYAFDLAKRREERSGVAQRVTCVDKSNVSQGCRLFRKVFREVASEYPGVIVQEAYIDAFAMWLMRNPEEHDVVVLPNMFGDIATDLASVLQGGLGMAASANVGEHHMMFEPVHGSAPRHSGMNKVNPIAMIASVQLMLAELGARHEDQASQVCAELLDASIAEVIGEGSTLSYDLGGDASTTDVGIAIAAALEARLKSTF